MFDRRITIFTGHFGSGKTEVAVNYALQTAERGKKTAIVDLDIVNPFFRTADVRNMLEDKGIKVVTPVYANTNVDVPSLPAEINTMFEDRSYSVVLDVGGDDLGARAVSRYKEQIAGEDHIHYFVVNTRRPKTNTGRDRKDDKEKNHRRHRCGHACHNAQCWASSTPELLGEASAIMLKSLKKLSSRLVHSGKQEVLCRILGDAIPKDLMKKIIRLPWE
jgi:hypothetical protein